jgi:hypothetical protein
MSPGQAAAAAPQEPHGSPHTLFQVQASNYSEFRPQYAQEVYDIILQHLDAHQRELAVDVATGSGQVGTAFDWPDCISTCVVRWPCVQTSIELL